MRQSHVDVPRLSSREGRCYDAVGKLQTKAAITVEGRCTARTAHQELQKGTESAAGTRRSYANKRCRSRERAIPKYDDRLAALV